VAYLLLVRSTERPGWVTNEEAWTRLCRKITALLRDVLESRAGIVAVSRELCALAHSVRADDDPDFITFTAIYSESDQLPIGEVRREWAPDALEKKDVEIRAVEDSWREEAFQAARNLLHKYT
jgi:hypothetical protein